MRTDQGVVKCIFYNSQVHYTSFTIDYDYNHVHVLAPCTACSSTCARARTVCADMSAATNPRVSQDGIREGTVPSEFVPRELFPLIAKVEPCRLNFCNSKHCDMGRDMHCDMAYGKPRSQARLGGRRLIMCGL